MNRVKIIATLVMSTLAFTALPVLPAAASASATAAISSGNAAVFPGSHTYTLTLKNTEAGTLITGKTIRWFRVFLPQTAGIVLRNDAAPSAPGWTATPERLGSTEFVTFTGGTLAAKASVEISVPTTARNPLSADRRGSWSISVADNVNGSPNSSASAAPSGSLDVRVMILDVQNVRPTAPFSQDPVTGKEYGVRDKNGTGGQTITYEFDVRNHAQSAVTADCAIATRTGSLVSSPETNDSPQPSASISVPAGGTGTCKVDIATVNTGSQRTIYVHAQATAAGPSESPVRNVDFLVQTPTSLKFRSSGPGSLDPTRVNDQPRDFTITVDKTGGAEFELQSSSLSFCTNTGPTSPTTFAPGNASKALVYTLGSISGDNNQVCAATTSTAGRDQNDAKYTFSNVAVGEIVIDLLGPALTVESLLPVDGDGDQQAASKNGDVITVQGIACGDDLNKASLKVKLLSTGASHNVTVTERALQSGDCPDTGGKGMRYQGNVVANWGSIDLGSFQAQAEMLDTARNAGTATETAVKLIDNVAPVLGGAKEDNSARFPGVVESKDTIRVRFVDTTGMRGGCNAQRWMIDGAPNSVRDVLLSDNTPCSQERARQLDDGVRILVLSRSLGVDETPTVTYERGDVDRAVGLYPAKDGASSDALTRTISTVTELVPLAPVLVNVNRLDSASSTATYEPAYFDAEEQRYYTNRAGDQGVRVRVGGVRVNYVIRVLDAAGNTLFEKTSTQPMGPGGTPVNRPQEWQEDVFVPLPTIDGPNDRSKDGSYVRRIVFHNPVTGNEGDLLEIQLGIDTAAPTISGAVYSATTSKVTVSFSDKIVEGSEFASDWFIGWNVDAESGDVMYRNANDITVPEDRRSRILTVQPPFPGAVYDSTKWRLGGGRRYEDRAGNFLPDSVF